MPIYIEKSNSQISDLVKLVRTDLATGTRITIEALIVLDVHGKQFTGSLQSLQNIITCYCVKFALFSYMFYQTYVS